MGLSYDVVRSGEVDKLDSKDRKGFASAAHQPTTDIPSTRSGGEHDSSGSALLPNFKRLLPVNSSVHSQSGHGPFNSNCWTVDRKSNELDRRLEDQTLKGHPARAR